MIVKQYTLWDDPIMQPQYDHIDAPHEFHCNYRCLLILAKNDEYIVVLKYGVANLDDLSSELARMDRFHHRTQS